MLEHCHYRFRLGREVADIERHEENRRLVEASFIVPEDRSHRLMTVADQLISHRSTRRRYAASQP